MSTNIIHTAAPEEAGRPKASPAPLKGLVRHPERSDLGEVVVSAAPAWTHDTLTVRAPDEWMVKVRWFGAHERSALFWEYARELTPADAQCEGCGREFSNVRGLRAHQSRLFAAAACRRPIEGP